MGIYRIHLHTKDTNVLPERMKERIIKFIEVYLLWLLIFVLQKPLFMLYYHELYADYGADTVFSVMLHGLPLDFSMAGYLTAIPALLLVVSVWTTGKWLLTLWKRYFAIVSIVVAVIFVADMGLYAFWGFRLDSTPIFYFMSSPRDALASVSVWYVLAALLSMVVVAGFCYLLFAVFTFPRRGVKYRIPFRRLTVSGVLLVLTALLFIPIRGGFTVSTMNTGKVFFSPDVRVNHAAINPAFNLMESLSKQKNFAKQYRFMDGMQADSLFLQMADRQVLETLPATDSLQHRLDSLNTVAAAAKSEPLFATQRPNVLLIIMESFSSELMSTLGGTAGVAVNLDSLSREAVLFTNFYANSFRTDRGLVAVLSGYPAQPTTSIMKYPRKTQNLPAIARSLKEAGYGATYYYGGDADFTNMRSYLISQGFERIVSDVDFPRSERTGKWGVHDHVVFNRLLDELKQEAVTYSTDSVPQYRVLQTSSSHEPFDVPFQKLDNKILNAFAYTDDCIGNFIRSFRQLPQWQNTVVVLVPDHLGAYPENINNFTPERYRIPLLMLGGAVRRPMKVDTFASQQDIAATLLAQLGLPHSQFTFSKDIFDAASPHFAFFTIPDAFGMATPENTLIYDNQAATVVYDEGDAKGANLLKGEAYLQKLYDDLAKR